MLHEIEHHLLPPKKPKKGKGKDDKEKDAKPRIKNVDQEATASSEGTSFAPARSAAKIQCQTIGDVIQDYHSTLERFTSLEVSTDFIEQVLGMSAHDNHDPFMLEDINELLDIIAKNPNIDFIWQRTINEAFLALVKAQYWHLLHIGHVGSREANTLMSSITKAINTPLDIVDFKYLCPDVTWQVEGDGTAPAKAKVNPMFAKLGVHAPRVPGGPAVPADLPVAKPSGLAKFIDSSGFGIFIAVAILSNSAFVMMEDRIKTNRNKDSEIWFVIEAVFTLIFTVEFALKFIVMKLQYFKSGWNIFDFALVILGWAGCILMLIVLVMGDDNNIVDTNASEGKMTRGVKVLKILRAVRMVRLVRVFASLGAKLKNKALAEDVGSTLQKMQVLEVFAQAHVNAQQELLRYFGRKNKAATSEVARTLVQSQVMIRKAVMAAWLQQEMVAPHILQDMRECEQTIITIEHLEHFVVSALQSGCLAAPEAQMITHAMHEETKIHCVKLKEMRAGWLPPQRADAAQTPTTKEAEGEKSGLVENRELWRAGEDKDEATEKISDEPAPEPFAKSQKKPEQSNLEGDTEADSPGDGTEKDLKPKRKIKVKKKVAEGEEEADTEFGREATEMDGENGDAAKLKPKPKKMRSSDVLGGSMDLGDESPDLSVSNAAAPKKVKKIKKTPSGVDGEGRKGDESKVSVMGGLNGVDEGDMDGAAENTPTASGT